MKTTAPFTTVPAAIGCYSPSIQADSIVYFSGQIALRSDTLTLVEGGIEPQLQQVFKNLNDLAKSVGGALNDIVKLTVFLTDINDIDAVNKAMALHLSLPYPARSVICVTALPKQAKVEIEAILKLPHKKS